MSERGISAGTPEAGAAPVPSVGVTNQVSTGARGAPRGLALDIERIVIHGLPLHGRDGVLLEAAFRVELERLAAAGALLSQPFTGNAQPSVRLDAIRVGSGRDPALLGRELADALWRGVTR